MAQEVQLKGRSGDLAEVGEDGRQKVDAVTQKEIAHISIDHGESYVIASDFIALTTTASFNGILYIKNTDSLGRAFHIEHFRVCGGLCAAGSTMQVEVVKDVTTGTLVSDANAATQNNLNTGSGNTFNGLAYSAAADAETITNGTTFTQFIGHSPGHSIQNYDGAIIIPRNGSIAVRLKPSTSMTVCMELIGYFE